MMNSDEIQASDAKIHQKKLVTNDHIAMAKVARPGQDDEADQIVQSPNVWVRNGMYFPIILIRLGLKYILHSRGLN